MSWTEGKHSDAPPGSRVVGTADGKVAWLPPNQVEGAAAPEPAPPAPPEPEPSKEAQPPGRHHR